MAVTVANGASTAHLIEREAPRPSPAKANLTNREVVVDARRRAGRCVERALAIANLGVKEAAALLGVDPAEVSRWISGASPVQVHRLLDCRQLHGPFAIAFASDAEGVSVDTVITVRRSA